jgi:signal recognition particle subunit SRP19
MGKKSGGVRIKQVGGSPKMPAMPMNFNPMEDLMQIPPDEMIQLPPPVNRKYQVFWPIHESFTMKTDKFQVIYPNYLDATKTQKQGRRISIQSAVDLPTVGDLSQALQLLGIRHVIQPYKGYSPDPTCLWDNPGRCLVDVSTFSKKELLELAARRIVDLPDRKVRLQREADLRTKEQAERVAAATAEAAAKVAANNSNLAKKLTTAGGSGTNNKKKAKGKRK